MAPSSSPTRRNWIKAEWICFMIYKRAYILLSGGQDSFTSLLWARENFSAVKAVSVVYGQRHEKELAYASKLARKYAGSHAIVDIGDMLAALDPSALLHPEENIADSHPVDKSLPASFVPNRNGLFLTLAANVAYADDTEDIHLIIGACQTDYSGYPDCRDVYIKAKGVELSLGLDRPVTIHTPLMWMDKAEAFSMVAGFGKLDELRENTLTCYNGVETLHPWGRGCSQCPACTLRSEGYENFTRLSG